MTKRTNIIIFLLAGVLLLPWLGEVVFNTKGEPREAIVAVSMLDSGNWILPQSYGADIPYKPPMLAWLISIFSLLFNGGHVSEFTSRMPSALAAIALLMAGWHWVATREGRTRAWLMLIVTATSFEFFRAATVCRVDMVMTACMVGAMYALYAIGKKKTNILWAILLLSGATLTKGPVGSLLPCLAMGIYFLLRGDKFWRTLATLSAICLASFILPALWYLAAYMQGGDEFLRLALEENIGRLTGTMSYDSHVNPWYYNVITIVAGMLPWTIFVIIGLCHKHIRALFRHIRRTRRQPLMAWTVALTVFLFYCLPESKRSVYLLPCYPFMAYGVARILGELRHTHAMTIMVRIFAAIAIIAPVILLAAQYIPAFRPKLEPMPAWRWMPALIPVVTGIWWLMTRKAKSHSVSGVCLFIFSLFLAYNAAFAPMVLNAKSDIRAASVIAAKVPDGVPVYGIIPEDKLLRYYTINYYLHDRMRRSGSADSLPAGSYVIAEKAPANALIIDTLTTRSCDTRRPVILFTTR